MVLYLSNILKQIVIINTTMKFASLPTSLALLDGMTIFLLKNSNLKIINILQNREVGFLKILKALIMEMKDIVTYPTMINHS